MKSLILFFLLTFPLLLSAQNRLSGRIIDGENGAPLAYVNIGILGAGIGTVSDMDGRFSFRASEGRTGTVKLSLLSYESKTFSVAELRNRLREGASISLQPKAIDLTEIVVVPKFTKTKVIGNPAKAAKLTDGFQGDELGREGGIIIDLPKRLQPAQVLKFRVHIARSTYDELKFRLNFYSVKNKIPYKPLPQESIIVTTDIKSGVLEVDLEDYNIMVNDDFAVTLEWIEDFGAGQLRFSFRRFGPRCVFRYASQDNWESYSGLLAPSPHLNVTVGYN